VFRFELARRSLRNDRSRPFPFADPITRDFLFDFIPDYPPIRTRKVAPGSGEAKYIELPAIAFCRTASRSAILEQIGRLIDKECEARHIKLPTAPDGKRNRPFSWLWVELLDRREILEEKLSDSDRSTLTEARRAAASFGRQLRELVKQEAQFEP